MKLRKVLVLILTVVALTGCTISNINTNDYMKNINTIYQERVNILIRTLLVINFIYQME